MLSKNQEHSNKSFTTIITLLVVGLVAFFAFDYFKTKHDKVVVAISQIVEHHSLDEERQGLLKALRENGFVEGENLIILYENAQGSISTATQIASKLVAEKPDAIVAISTPSAQSLASLCNQYQIPLIFTAVTDPEGAKLIDPDKREGSMVTGVSDFISSGPHFELMKKLAPELVSVGIIYNSGEANSVALVQDVKRQAAEMKIEVVTAVANKTGDVAAAAEKLVSRGVDMIYIPNDNTAVSAMESIVRVGENGYHDQSGNHRTVPVFAGDSGSVYKGAMATAGYDREKLGYKAGLMVVDILKGKAPGDIKVSKNHDLKSMFNLITAKRLNIEISPALLLNAKIIGSEGNEKNNNEEAKS